MDAHQIGQQLLIIGLLHRFIIERPRIAERVRADIRAAGEEADAQCGREKALHGSVLLLSMIVIRAI